MQLLLRLIDSLYSTLMGACSPQAGLRGLMSNLKRRTKQYSKKQKKQIPPKTVEIQYIFCLPHRYIQSRQSTFTLILVFDLTEFKSVTQVCTIYKRSECSSTRLTYRAIKYILSCTFIKAFRLVPTFQMDSRLHKVI